MNTKGNVAEQYFKEGYNCAQLVAPAFKEELMHIIKRDHVALWLPMRQLY